MTFELQRVEVPAEVRGLTAVELLRRMAANGGEEYVMLHSAAGSGTSVLAWGVWKKVCVGDGVGQEPLDELAREVEGVRFESPHALVGWLGFVSYEVGRTLERVSALAQDDLGWPVVYFCLFKRYLVMLPGGEMECYVARGEAVDWEMLTREPEPPPTATAPARLVKAQTRQVYERRVEAVKKYIADGDIYQANLAQRWDFAYEGAAEEAFAKLCALSAAPYAACMRFEFNSVVRQVVSASPELFLAVEFDGDGREVVTRPIKGTRPRDLGDATRDAALKEELVASAKDHAELTMIVDLLRNDLGRVAEYGTVRVIEERAVEGHPTVWHTVATIEARLRRGAGVKDILAALCPGGSITGAPKIRAMQIIEELEPVRRQLYCGNIGVIGPGGQTTALNVAIRTILMQEGKAYVYAGGGIVADSEPAREYDETMVKARAMFRSLGAE